MFSHAKLAFAAVAAVTLAAVSPLAAQTPVQWTATVAKKTAAAGADVSVKLSAKLDEGWHIYSVTQGPGGPFATRVTTPDSSVFFMAGKPKSSVPPATKFDENFGIEVETYEKTVDLSVPLKVAAKAKKGAAKSVVAVRYQACNASMCLPPKTEKLEVALNVVSKGGK